MGEQGLKGSVVCMWPKRWKEPRTVRHVRSEVLPTILLDALLLPNDKVSERCEPALPSVSALLCL